MSRIHTQVAIVGAGPAGLMLSHLLHLRGIHSVVIEIRSREHCERRVRAGVLEQGSDDLLRRSGVASRLEREAMFHHGIHIGFNRRRHFIPLTELTEGKCVTIYGQQEVVKDLIAQRLADRGDVRFDCSDVAVHDLEGPTPWVCFLHGGEPHELAADFIAGCDGFHGICRPSIPAAVLQVFEKTFPFGWLGILAEAPPTSNELVYMHHERGFALFSMRSQELTRLYLQTSPDEDLAQWPDNRIWNELFTRFECADGWLPRQGKILQKSVTGMRSFVVEPMQYGRLFLAGDAAHIVPPTGAKGMNLAMADVWFLSVALDDFYARNSTEKLESYSSVCLERVWKAQRFSWWMTSLLHCFPDHDAFDRRRQIAELNYLTSSRAASTSLAENYVGLPLPLDRE
jgi:p-hydroxybenzoate 3-monooxygenase